MWERTKTAALVVVITLLVWLWAESASLSSGQAAPRLEIAPSATLRAVALDPDWTGTARVRLRGGRAALSAAQRLLAGPLRLAVGEGAIPAVAGEHTVDLREALRRHADLRRAGVAIDEVEPGLLRVRVEPLPTPTPAPPARR